VLEIRYNQGPARRHCTLLANHKHYVAYGSVMSIAGKNVHMGLPKGSLPDLFTPTDIAVAR
jgi:hypothetical protein